MPTERNKDTKEALTQEIKALKLRCVDAIHAIENAPPEHGGTPENIQEKTLCYVEGLRTELQNSHTPITTDEYLLTAQFLNEMNEKKKQIEEMVAFTRGAICDADREIERLTNHLKTSELAQSQPSCGVEVTPDHVEEAQQRFKVMRKELWGLIQSLFPGHFEDMKMVLGQLMSAHMSGPTQSKYIQVTDGTYPMIEMLLGLKLVVLNPYDKAQVKLAY